MELFYKRRSASCRQDRKAYFANKLPELMATTVDRNDTPTTTGQLLARKTGQAFVEKFWMKKKY